MKNYILFLLVFLVSVTSSGQEKMDFVYLFDDFQKGAAVYKLGTTSSGQFNYELTNGKIHFKDNNTTFELAYPESIRYIEIGNHTFEHVKGDMFYEKIDAGSGSLYVYHQGSLVSKGKPSGYGSRTQTAAVESINRIPTSTGWMDLNIDELFEIKKKDSYYLKINGKFKRFNSINSLAKLFKGHEKEIENELKNENLNFNNSDDIIKAVDYCNRLITDL